MVRFVNNEQPRIVPDKIEISSEGLDHRVSDLPVDPLLRGIDDSAADLRVVARERRAVLGDKLVPVLEDESGLVDLRDNRREHDGLAGAGRRDPERVAFRLERADAAIDENLLAWTQDHSAAIRATFISTAGSSIWRPTTSRGSIHGATRAGSFTQR